MVTKLKPVNGVLKCFNCEFYPSQGTWHIPAVPDAKTGDACVYCKDSGYAIAGTYALDLTTQLGPSHVIDLTGNPLLDAATVLEVDGWVDGSWVCEKGKKCLDGALRAACGLFPSSASESHPWGFAYSTTKTYQRNNKRLHRAEFTLAETILETLKKAKAGTRAADLRERYEREGWYGQDLQLGHAVEIITNYNDEVVATAGKRKDAIKVLLAAAVVFNPRRKLPT